MITYGQHPRSGNLVKVLKCVSKQPPLYSCRVIAQNRIYKTNYTKTTLETKFEPLSARKYKELAQGRIQLALF